MDPTTKPPAKPLGGQALPENIEFSKETLRLNDLAGRRIRLVTDGDKVIIKADSLISSLFHVYNSKEHYAKKAEIQLILTNIITKIPKDDLSYKKTTKLLLQQFNPKTPDEKQAFMKCFKELYAKDKDNPFNALDLSDTTKLPNVYDFLSKAGALSGDGQKLKEYIKEYLLSGRDLSFVSKDLLNEVAKEAFKALKDQAVGMPKGRLFEYVDKLGELGFMEPCHKFGKLRDMGWIGSQKSPDKTKFDNLLNDCRTIAMSKQDAYLDRCRTHPDEDPNGKNSEKARGTKAAMRDLLYPDQKLTDLEKDVCIAAGLTSMEVDVTLGLMRDRHVRLTEKFMGELLDSVKDLGKKNELRDKIEDMRLRNHPKFKESERYAKKIAESINRILADENTGQAITDKLEELKKKGESVEHLAFLRLVSKNIDDKHKTAFDNVVGRINPRAY